MVLLKLMHYKIFCTQVNFLGFYLCFMYIWKKINLHIEQMDSQTLAVEIRAGKLHQAPLLPFRTPPMRKRSCSETAGDHLQAISDPAHALWCSLPCLLESHQGVLRFAVPYCLIWIYSFGLIWFIALAAEEPKPEDLILIKKAMTENSKREKVPSAGLDQKASPNRTMAAFCPQAGTSEQQNGAAG